MTDLGYELRFICLSMIFDPVSVFLPKMPFVGKLCCAKGCRKKRKPNATKNDRSDSEIEDLESPAKKLVPRSFHL